MSTLIEEIKSGNKDAVKAIYQEYAKDVYNFAKSITGDHDSALAATKKTFGKLISNIKKGDEPKEIRTTLLKIAYDEACSMAMPALNNEPEAEAAPAEETSAPKKVRQVRATKPVDIEEAAAPEREEIYMPKGPLQVEETVEEAVEDVQEMPRKRRPAAAEDGSVERPRKRRPVAEGEEVPRKRKPVAAAAVAEEAVETVAEKPRKRRAAVEEEPIEFPVAEETEVAEEEFEIPQPKKKARPVREEKPVDVYDALEEEDDYDDSYDEEDGKPRNKGLFIFCIIINIILILILLWFLGGLLVNLGVLPQIDLGYTWFNDHIYPLF